MDGRGNNMLVEYGCFHHLLTPYTLYIYTATGGTILACVCVIKPYLCKFVYTIYGSFTPPLDVLSLAFDRKYVI